MGWTVPVPFGLPAASRYRGKSTSRGQEGYRSTRPVLEADDFGEEFTPELRTQEERLRAEIERRKSPS